MCFVNKSAFIYCVLCYLYCVFVLSRLCLFILIPFACTSIRTTATELKINFSNSNNDNNNNNISFCVTD